MVRIGFEAPKDAADIVTLLNKTQKWKFTLSLPDGTATGLLPTLHPVVMQNAEAMHYTLINGDDLESAKAVFITDDLYDALAFLHGMYLGQFGDIPLEHIQDNIAAYDRLFGEDVS